MTDNPTPALPLSGEGVQTETQSNQSHDSKINPYPPPSSHDGETQKNVFTASSHCDISGEQRVKSIVNSLRKPHSSLIEAPVVNPESKHGNNQTNAPALHPSPCQGGGWEGVFNGVWQKDYRRSLRKNPTEPEARLWAKIRGRQLGTKFRRQHGIGRYIADFYCAEFALVIELDGDSHYTHDALAADQQRNDFMGELGLTVMRFSNQDVMQNIEGVLILIANAIDSSNETEIS